MAFSYKFQKACWNDAFYFDLTILLQWNTLLSFFCCYSTYFYGNSSIPSAASNVNFNLNLNPGGLLKRKTQQANDVKLLLPLIEAMKILTLTSLPADMFRLSSPKPTLSYGKRHAHLSLLNLILNQSILFSVLSLVLLPHHLPHLTFTSVVLPENRHRSTPTI